MVLVRDVAQKMRDDECRSIRERLSGNTEKLNELYMQPDAVRKLQAIETAIDRLIGAKPPPRVPDRREGKREYYKKNKSAVLGQQRKRRQELRAMAQEQSKKAKEVKQTSNEEKPGGQWERLQVKIARLARDNASACVHKDATASRVTSEGPSRPHSETSQQGKSRANTLAVQ